MPVGGAGCLPPPGVRHEAADVVHLQPQQVPDAVRQEDARDPAVDRLLGAAQDEVRLAQDLGGQRGAASRCMSRQSTPARTRAHSACCMRSMRAISAAKSASSAE